MLINVWADMYITVICEKCGEGAFIRDNYTEHSMFVRNRNTLKRLFVMIS